MWMWMWMCRTIIEGWKRISPTCKSIHPRETYFILKDMKGKIGDKNDASTPIPLTFGDLLLGFLFLLPHDLALPAEILLVFCDDDSTGLLMAIDAIGVAVVLDREVCRATLVTAVLVVHESGFAEK